MKLSYVLDTYLVIAMSETVGFTMPEDNDTAISVRFTCDGQDYEQWFNDQDIVPDPTMQGSFVVTDVDGEQCQFTAVEPVTLVPRS